MGEHNATSNPDESLRHATSNPEGLRHYFLDVNSSAIIFTTTPAMMTTMMTTHRPRWVPQVPWDVQVVISSFFGVGLNVIISTGGLVANAIVMIVFYRQGIMNESSTVSLFTLALTDFLTLVCHVAWGFGIMGWLLEAERVIGPMYLRPVVIQLMASRIKFLLSHILCWLTAYLAFERCFSVLFPFKVKRVFSPRNSLIAIACIYTGSILTFLPLTAQLGVRTVTGHDNKTFILPKTNFLFPYKIVRLAIALNPTILRPIGIVIVVMSNLIILIKVRSSKKWRESTVATSSRKETSLKPDKKSTSSSFQKEGKLIKMISMISAIFLVCILPDMLLVLLTQTSVAIFDFTVQDAWYRMTFFTESVNSAINILVYYFMSTNFKKQFRQLFAMDKK